MAGLFRSQSSGDHRFCASNLSAYMDGALSVRSKQRVERHLAGCALCRQDLMTLRQTRALLRRVPMRPVPRSFALPASMGPEQVRYRRWATTYSVLRLGTVAVTLMLVLLLSGDVLLSGGVLPVPDGSRPDRELVAAQPAAPDGTGTQVTVNAEATQPTSREGATSQQEGYVPGNRDVEGPAASSQATAAAEVASSLTSGSAPAIAQPTRLASDTVALSAPQPMEAEGLGGAQVEQAAETGGMVASAPPSAAMAPKRAGAQPAPTAAEHKADKTSGFGAGPTRTEPSLAATATLPAPAPTVMPTATHLPTKAAPTVAPPTVAPTLASTHLAMGSAARPTTSQDAPAAAQLAPGLSSPVWELWRTLRLLWIGMLGLLLILLGGLLWVGTKQRP
jgi:anti-sigma factor RsiW